MSYVPSAGPFLDAIETARLAAQLDCLTRRNREKEAGEKASVAESLTEKLGKRNEKDD